MERLDLNTSSVTKIVGNLPYGQGLSDDTENIYWVDTTGTAFEGRKFDTRYPSTGSTVINATDTHGPYVTVWARGKLYWGEDACKTETATCPVVSCVATPTSDSCTTTSTAIAGTGDVTAMVANDTMLFAGTSRGSVYQYALN